MVKSKIAMLLLAALSVTACMAQEPSAEDAIRKSIQPKLREGVKIDSIKATPYAGLYEVSAAGDILYTDKKGEFLFIGEVINAKTSRNITKERVDELNKVKLSDLPLDSALKTVKGDGKRMLVLFEDPNCGYCKQFRKTTLKDLDNVTVYTFMYNILSEDSAVKSRNIWCSPDRNKAWDDWMVNGKAAPAADCPNPNDKISALGRKLKISGTPSIFFADGTRLPGAVGLKDLEAKLATVKAQ